MKKTHLIEFILSLLLISGCNTVTEEINQPYQGWNEGEIDIHHIFTGRGESNFLILPDGTSMLVDAGDYDPKDYPNMCKALPDTSRRAGEWVARYIQRVNPFKDKVDYLMISHFHNDHTGDCTMPGLQTKNDEYILVGITQVAEEVQFAHIFDRGWPNYNYPVEIKDPDVDNLKKFIAYQQKQNGLSPEKFIVGKKNQIKLLHNPEVYKNLFTVRNLSANGEVWTGKDQETIKYYDLNRENLVRYQNENTKSLSFRLDYGDFSYYMGGDMSSFVLDADGNQLDVEEKTAEACGMVDVCKVNHHGYLDAMSEGFIKNIKASKYIFPIWESEHIQLSVLERIMDKSLYEGERTLYFTGFSSKKYAQLENKEWFNSVCKDFGHVVVKVLKGGKEYKIYILSPENEEMIVKGVYGPFNSRA